MIFYNTAPFPLFYDGTPGPNKSKQNQNFPQNDLMLFKGEQIDDK